MIRYSEKDRANYPRESFWCKETGTRVKILPRVSANRRSNNWALESNVVSIEYIGKDIDVWIRESYYAFNLLNPILKNSRRFETAHPPPPPTWTRGVGKQNQTKVPPTSPGKKTMSWIFLRRVSVTIPLEAREKSESELKTSSLRQR